MAVQDDAREQELAELFELEQPDTGRSGTDAILCIDEQTVEFELKSTTRGSVTTVRDFGPEHVAKWTGKHWLIGFYNLAGTQLKYSIYGSPQAMAPWIEEKARYVKPDFDLAEAVPSLVTQQIVEGILGEKEIYTIEDARSIQKRQYRSEQYRQLMDVLGGFTPDRMLEIIRERTQYLLSRGATLNNPHIPARYFDGWEHITQNHAQRLRELVRQVL